MQNTSIFSLFCNVFYPIRDKSQELICCLQTVQNFVVGLRLGKKNDYVHLVFYSVAVLGIIGVDNNTISGTLAVCQYDYLDIDLRAAVAM